MSWLFNSPSIKHFPFLIIRSNIFEKSYYIIIRFQSIMKKNNVYILEDRGLLYVNGEDAKDFLQNIITNDVEKVSNLKIRL